MEALTADGLVSCVAVITQPARPTGRHHTMTPTEAAAWGKKQRLPVYEWESLRERTEDIRALQAEFFLVASYGVIIPKSVLDVAPGQCLNIHASLLPKYRGASPIAQVVLNGEQETGITIMQVVPALDAGPIIDTYHLPIAADDTAATLREKLSQLAAKHICPTIEKFWQGALQPREQVDAAATYAGKISRLDGQAHWESAEQEIRKLRAYDPWPGLWTTINDQRLKILQATSRRGTPTAPRGTIEQIDPVHWGIVCDDGWVVPEIVQREGKKPSQATQLVHDISGLLGSRCD